MFSSGVMILQWLNQFEGKIIINQQFHEVCNKRVCFSESAA